MAIASIGTYEWPEGWPDLLPSLLKLITDQTNMNRGKPLECSSSVESLSFLSSYSF